MNPEFEDTKYERRHEKRHLILRIKTIYFDNDIIQIMTVSEQTHFDEEFVCYPLGDGVWHFGGRFKASNDFVIFGGCDEIRQYGLGVRDGKDSPNTYHVIPSKAWLVACRRAVQEYNGTVTDNDMEDLIEVIE